MIIVVVFGVMLTIMLIAFIVNCMRKIMRDHKIIRVSIESKSFYDIQSIQVENDVHGQIHE